MQLIGKNVSYMLLSVTCLATLITAISGFFLGQGTASKGDLLYWHQILGAALAIGMSSWYWIVTQGYGKNTFTNILSITMLLLVGFTGHYGGMITHGENFLALPGGTKRAVIPENPMIYKHIVNRILDEKCVKCHNSNKTKGEFLMTDLTNLIKGGESGAAILPGRPEESEIITRLELPEESEDHMPPEGETPLSESEIRILHRWIALGASDTIRLNHLESNDPLALLVKEMMAPDPGKKWEQLPKIADSTLTHMGSDYLTITRIAAASNALRIAMYGPPEYHPDFITKLKPISDNVVELDLSNLPIGKEEMDMIAGCKNLEWLEINGTPVDDDDLDTLKVLSKLRLLKVYETNIGDNSIALFEGLENLEQLYLWETAASEAALERLKAARPELEFFNGIDKELQTFFTKQDSLPVEENAN
jgi:hypothetical protein